MSRDTWEGSYNSPQSLNRWNYTQSNPVNYTDPSGYCISGVLVDTIVCLVALAAGTIIIAGVTAAAYDFAMTQGGGIGGFNEKNLGCIDLYQVMEAGKDASLGVTVTGAETLASIPLSPYYLAKYLSSRTTPAEVNIEILHEFGLDDEYIAAMGNPNFVAGKLGGDVPVLYLSLRAFFAGLPTKIIPKSTPLYFPQIDNGVMSLRLVLNVPGFTVVGGSGKLVSIGLAGFASPFALQGGGGGGGGEGRHANFIRQLKSMKDSSLRKTIRSLEDNMQEHLYKIANNPTSRDVPHWQSEINTFREQLELAIQEAKLRGLR
jgi:hypothetical protein